MDSVKKLTVKSAVLGESVVVMLCFTPPGGPNSSPKQSAVAWKVATLRGPETMRATYYHTPSVCVAKAALHDIVSAREKEYIAISPGQKSTVEKSGSGYKWTPTLDRDGTAISAKNGTDTALLLGVGFISDKGTPDKEAMTPTVVYDNISSQTTLDVEYEPEMRLYINADCQEKQKVDPKLIVLDPALQAKMLSLKPETTFEVYKTLQGEYKARIVSGDSLSGLNLAGLDLGGHDLGNSVIGTTVIYHATLLFGYANHMVPAFKNAVPYLLDLNYKIEIISHDGEKEAQIRLSLPPGADCAKAEMTMKRAMRSEYHTFWIKMRSGQYSKLIAKDFSYWTNIKPNTPEWGRSSEMLNSDAANKEIDNTDVQANGDAHGDEN